MYAESSGRGKAWIMIPLNVRSLSAYKKCEIVQVPGMTFLPLAASFLYAKGRYTYDVCKILGFLDPLPIWLNIRKIGTFLDPNPPQPERHMCMPQELLHRHSNGAPEE